MALNNVNTVPTVVGETTLPMMRNHGGDVNYVKQEQQRLAAITPDKGHMNVGPAYRPFDQPIETLLISPRLQRAFPLVPSLKSTGGDSCHYRATARVTAVDVNKPLCPRPSTGEQSQLPTCEARLTSALYRVAAAVRSVRLPPDEWQGEEEGAARASSDTPTRHFRPSRRPYILNVIRNVAFSRSPIFFSLIVMLQLGLSRSLYFHIGETEKRCFIEEIPDETMVIGNYKTQLWDKQSETFLPSTPGLGMHVEVKDPDGKPILSRQYGSEGRFIFTSHTPGEHQICLHSNSTRMSLFAGGKLRVHLDIQIGEHTNNYPEIAAKDKLTELQLRVRQLLDQVEQIQKEQNYQRYREERFRLTSESTNQRVLWWSIAQTLILILTGIWQMRHLKSFFEAKKLV
ncbi:transmembrane emp24 domain-containing protein 4 [Pelodytes ibericus]